MQKSNNMPEIPWGPPVDDLISNFTHNWGTLTPALLVLFGVIFAGFVIKKIINRIRGED